MAFYDLSGIKIVKKTIDARESEKNIQKRPSVLLRWILRIGWWGG
jgi:hypothetical protein